MEKRTIGGLIAALRKANGLTQRELAEKLGVSDKTVSRWERDEGLPDLALIPVLAEIFGVTCDELLRGARTAPQDRETEPSPSSVKGEKQRKHLLAQSLRRFQNRSWIAAGIAVSGLLAAAIANLGFLRAYVGFFLGAAVYLAAAICQGIFVNNARYAVDEECLEPEALLPYRRQVQRRTESVILLIAALLGATFPLLFVGDAHWGVSGGSWLLGGLICGGIAVLAAAVFLYFFHGSQLRKGTCPLPEKERAAFVHNRRWKRLCALLLVGVGAVTFLLHMALTTIWGPMSIMSGTTFTDYESFVAFMEQDVPYPSDTAWQTPEPVDAPIYYDEHGNEISEEEALRETLELPDGTVACEYIDRNKSVVSIRYAPKEDTLLPITVCTQQDLENARQVVAVRHVIFAAVYCVEVAGAVLLYFGKRKKNVKMPGMQLHAGHFVRSQESRNTERSDFPFAATHPPR